MGFVPLAFRTGSEKKSRVHIFWQKRIRQGDVTTPWWFPSKTDAGAMRADRIVLPIPPGVRWHDEMPRVLGDGNPKSDARNSKQIRSTKPQVPPVPVRQPVHFRPPGARPVVAETPAPEPVIALPKVRRPKVKSDPKLVSAARELRDRWLDEVNGGRFLIAPSGKYDVSRAIEYRQAAAAAGLLEAA